MFPICRYFFTIRSNITQPQQNSSLYQVYIQDIEISLKIAILKMYRYFWNGRSISPCRHAQTPVNRKLLYFAQTLAHSSDPIGRNTVNDMCSWAQVTNIIASSMKYDTVVYKFWENWKSFIFLMFNRQEPTQRPWTQLYSSRVQPTT